MYHEYVYYCPMRPPTIGSIPTYGLLYVEALDERKYIAEIDRMAWGWAVYRQELTPQEVADYELVMKPRENVRFR